ELFFLQLGLALRRSAAGQEPGTAFPPSTRLVPALQRRLPFRPTGAQERAFAEIAADLAAPHPMRRLLQGDVGSGKTLVAPRAALQRRGAESVDVLVMSATPIPRTLALTLYGDLAVSTLDELPPGRTPITTELCRESRRERVYGRIRGEIAAGHQAYIVYPLVEESEK